MSAYQLNKAVFDRLRTADGAYDLTDDERRALDDQDVRALYQLGLHPVLLNAFARAIGLRRDDYRVMLDGLHEERGVKARWQK